MWGSGKSASSPLVLCAAGLGSRLTDTDLSRFYAVSTAKAFFVTNEAANTLRLAPTLARRLKLKAHCAKIDLQQFKSLVRLALSFALL